MNSHSYNFRGRKVHSSIGRKRIRSEPTLLLRETCRRLILLHLLFEKPSAGTTFWPELGVTYDGRDANDALIT